MMKTVLKSKIHRATVTHCDISAENKLTIDSLLMKQANFIENEQVHIVNNNNGERIITYITSKDYKPGFIHFGGADARKFQIGDIIIIFAYCQIDNLDTYIPQILFPDSENRI